MENISIPIHSSEICEELPVPAAVAPGPPTRGGMGGYGPSRTPKKISAKRNAQPDGDVGRWQG